MITYDSDVVISISRSLFQLCSLSQLARFRSYARFRSWRGGCAPPHPPAFSWGGFAPPHPPFGGFAAKSRCNLPAFAGKLHLREGCGNPPNAVTALIVQGINKELTKNHSRNNSVCVVISCLSCHLMFLLSSHASPVISCFSCIVCYINV